MKRAPLLDQSPVLGIALMTLAVTVFTVMSAFIKAADRVPAGEAMFFRAFFTLPVIVVWLVARGDLLSGIRTSNLRSHAVRGIAGSAAMGLGFAGLKYLPLPEVTAIRFVTPVVMLILAALLLGERLRLVRISAVTVGLIGVVIIVWPRLSAGAGTTEAFGAMIVLGSACLAALAQVFVKSMAGRESTAAIVFYFALTASVLSLFTLPFGWVWPTWQEAVLLVGAGIVGGIGQILLTSSYRFAEAGVLAPFTYVSMLWSIIIGYVWFLEIPTPQMLFGAGLIILAGVIIVYRERQLGTQKTARRKVEAKGIQ
ncbi:DMT family transporter [Octadecabacter sp. R77987]|uniref:DMT family transporter n=1 Tax=Octadecabacter sp. R77987 TaxID=3093874 RepID=UPI0036714A21